MNDKIRELLSQAITDVDYIHFDKDIDEELSQMYIPDVFAERFAELIIRECARVTFKGTGPRSALNILEHFGVEE